MDLLRLFFCTEADQQRLGLIFFHCSSSMFIWSFSKYSPASRMLFLQRCCHSSNTCAFFVRSLKIASLFFSTASEVSNRMLRSFAFSNGNKKKSQGARLGQMRYTGNVKFGQKLHDMIRDMRLCIVTIKSPSGPMSYGRFFAMCFCNRKVERNSGLTLFLDS